MRHFQAVHVPLWVVVVAVGLSAGCGSSKKGPERSAKAVESFKETRKNLSDANKQVKATNDSLAKLTSGGGGDLRKMFNDYSGNVKKTQDSAKRARERAAAMRQNTDNYVNEWQKEMEQITDAELRRQSEQRAAAAKAEFQKVRSVAQEARAAYEPYMQGLQDVEQYLANDLTAAGVQSVRPKAQSTLDAGQKLQEKLTQLESELDALSTRWSSKQ